MRPWNFDAGSLNPGEISKSYIFQNEIIKAYLDSGKHDRSLFLVGSKGSGKTLLIRYKAYSYWNKNNPDIPSNESGELVENLDFAMKSLSQNDLRILTNESHWVDIWKFTLYLTVLRKSKVDLPEEYRDELNKVFRPSFRVSNIVSKLLLDVPKFVNSDYLARRNNELMADLGQINSGVSLFIDRLDQALDSMWNNGTYSDQDPYSSEHLPFEVWKTAQFSLMKACYDINSFNSHIKIYTTIRAEAIMTSTTLKENVLNFCTFLEYSKEELKEIFLNNIKMTNSSKYTARTKANWFKLFFGFDTIKHLYVNDSYGEKEEEDIFDFLFRHTFGRPREVLRIGKRVYDELINTPDFPKKITSRKSGIDPKECK